MEIKKNFVPLLLNHQVTLDYAPGKHTLTIVDEQGEYLEWRFKVLTK